MVGFPLIVPGIESGGERDFLRDRKRLGLGFFMENFNGSVGSRESKGWVVVGLWEYDQSLLYGVWECLNVSSVLSNV